MYEEIASKVNNLSDESKEVIEALEYLYKIKYHGVKSKHISKLWRYKFKIISENTDLVLKFLNIFSEKDHLNILSIIKTTNPSSFFKEENIKIIKEFIINKIKERKIFTNKGSLLLADIITSKSSDKVDFYSEDEYRTLFKMLYIEKHPFIYSDKARAFIRRISRVMLSKYPDIIMPHVKSGHFTGGSKYFREAVYSAMIDEGLLTKKYARRLRSESVEDVSFRCINRMFKRRSDYTEKEYKVLCSQLVDVKHEKSSQLVAMFLPKSLLPFAVGLNSNIAKKIVQERMIESKQEGLSDEY